MEKQFVNSYKLGFKYFFFCNYLTTLHFFRLVSALQFVKTRPNGKTIVDRIAVCPPHVNYLLEFNWNAAFQFREIDHWLFQTFFGSFLVGIIIIPLVDVDFIPFISLSLQRRRFFILNQPSFGINSCPLDYTTLLCT